MINSIHFKDRERNHRSRKPKPRKVRKNQTSPLWMKNEKPDLGDLVIFELSIRKITS